MQLSVLTRAEGERTVLHLAGELDLYTAAGLRARLAELISAGHHLLVVDLDHLDFIDAIGVSVLIDTWQCLQANGGRLRLVCGEPSILNLLRVGGLSGEVELHPDLDAARCDLPPTKGVRP
jgi:anti-sigma B factor antagonist